MVDKINWMLTNCRRSTGNGRLCALIEVINGHSTAERQLHMRMRINAAGNDQTIGSINNPDTARHHKVRSRTHVLDDAVLDVDVSRKSAVMIDNLTAFDVQPAL